MDVTFETNRGEVFEIELGYWDTVLEIKERIQKYRGIPVAHQTLNFNGKDLDDDVDIEKSEILHKSRVRVIIARATPTPEKSQSAANNEMLPPNRPSAFRLPPLPPAPPPPRSYALHPPPLPSGFHFPPLPPPRPSAYHLPPLPPPRRPSAYHLPPLPPPRPIPRSTQIILRMPSSSSSKQLLTFEVDLNDTVKNLKKMIHEIEGVNIPPNRILLRTELDEEMQDHLHLHNYNLTDGSEVDISAKPVPILPAPPPQMVPGSKKLRVFVVPRCETMRLPIEVSPLDKVQVLRGELEMLQQSVAFDLPADGYFFIHRQSVMEERESFQWNRVRQGDIIEIFPGTVTDAPGPPRRGF